MSHFYDCFFCGTEISTGYVLEKDDAKNCGVSKVACEECYQKEVIGEDQTGNPKAGRG